MIWLDLVIVGVLLLGLGIGAKRGFCRPWAAWRLRSCPLPGPESLPEPFRAR